MRAPSKKTMTLIAGIAAAGAVVGSTLPANAVQKGHDTTSNRPAAHKTVTGSATRASSAARPNLTTGDACSAYSDGHGDLCMWYFSNYNGSNTGFLRSDYNLNDDHFVSAGSGQNSLVTNNAESVWNYDHYTTAYVATSPGFTGSIGYIRPWTGGNFSSTYSNNVESLYWAN
jgi:hypothetical protein